MSIVFAAITPHPPILIPSIGKENIEKIHLTKIELAKLGEKLLAAAPERIIIISPHGSLIDESFAINLDKKYEATFEDFGDFTTKLNFLPDFDFISTLSKKAFDKNFACKLITDKLDYGCAVPLFAMSLALAKIPIVPVYYTNLSLKKHFEFGKIIQQEIFKDNKRTAVIASGDFSHKILDSSKKGLSKKAISFDKNLIDLLSENDINSILNFSKKQLDEVKECAIRSISILGGILDGLNVKFTMHSYEYPFGVGYLVSDYEFL